MPLVKDTVAVFNRRSCMRWQSVSLAWSPKALAKAVKPSPVASEMLSW
jgi:hypothetical protein